MLKRFSYLVRNGFSYSVLRFIFVFGVLKSLVFIVPLLLSNLLAIEDYASLESSLAFSNVAIIFINLGVSSAIPLYILKEDNAFGVGYVYLHVLGASIFLFLTAAVLHFANVGSQWVFVSLVLLVLCNQRVISSHRKTLSKPVLSCFFESYLFVVLFVCLVYGWCVSGLGFSQINVFLAVFGAVLLGVSVKELYCSGLDFSCFKLSGLSRLYYFSGAALIVSALIILAITLVRLLGVPFLQPEAFVAYGIAFRLCSISIILFQLVVTLKFKELYSAAPNYLDIVFVRIVVGVLVMSFSVFVFCPLFSKFIFQDHVLRVLAENKQVFMPVVLLMPLWAASAILENIVARERVFKGVLFFAMVLVTPLLVLFLIFSLSFSLNVVVLLYFHFLLVSLVVLAQLFALRRVGVNLVTATRTVVAYSLLGIGVGFGSLSS